MLSGRRIAAVLAARNREFVRDRGALSWTFLFPLLMVLGFFFGFSGDRGLDYSVGVTGPSVDHPFLRDAAVRLLPFADRQQGLESLRRRDIEMLFEPATGDYWVHGDSLSSMLLESLLWRSISSPPQGVQKATVDAGRQIHYIDWLLPGLLGMNIMFAALFGVGYVLVRYRKNGTLRRFMVTPLTPLEFMIAQVLSRLAVIVLITVSLYAGIVAVLGVGHVSGSIPALLLLLLIGSVALIAMGLLIGAWMRSEEMANGLLNLMSLPSMFLSGVWFSTEGLDPWAQWASKLFPLTHILSAAREVILHGADLLAILPQLGFLVVLSLLLLLLSVLIFRWE